MRQYLFIIILTAAVTFVVGWVVWHLSHRFKIYPGIRERDVHTTPTPRIGGIAIYVGIMVAIAISSQVPFFAIFWERPASIWAIVIASTVIVLVGIADDLLDLDWMIKLAAQFITASIVAYGGLQIYYLPFGGVTVLSSWLLFGLTVFVIVFVMNAVNFIDGLDGLVAGVVLISNVIFFLYSYMFVRDFGTSTNSSLATFIAAAIIGACIGFLPLNWRPARMFMGDSGALLLGLLMATSAIAITGEANPEALSDAISDDRLGESQLLGALIPILLPVVVLTLPLTDFGLAVMRRLRAGKSPFSPDRKHLHHRMLDHGHTAMEAVLIFYSWTAVVCLSVLLMYIATRDRWPGLWWVGVIFGVVGIIACLVVTIIPSRRRPIITAPDLEDAS